MIKLDGGIVLPLPKKAKGFERPDDISDWKWRKMKPGVWERAYLHCLYSLPLHFDLPLHSVVPRLSKKMLEASDPMNVALRFMGEMWKAGYIDLERGMDERIVVPTKKFLDLKLDCERAPDSAIQLPVTNKKDLRSSPIRGGIANRSNIDAISITSEMAVEQFEVNEFMVDIIKRYPPEFDKSSSAYMYKRMLRSIKEVAGKTFYFPQFVDSRSRMYVDTTCGFSPQGADHEKAILQPTYREPLTFKGFDALLEATHGYSEQPWDLEVMLNHARNPHGNTSWLKADKPYCYLACAKLVSDYMLDPLTPLPAFIPLDGRCSGLQHWSAVTRSNAITRHLGMHIDEADLDIYEKVAADWAETLPDEWKFLATRKAAKIPVMTWGYNATIMTSMEHIDKLFGAKKKWNKELAKYEVVGSGLERAVTGEKGADLYRRLNETLGPLRAAVDWVSNCATVIAGKGNCNIRWPTPDGFMAMQRKVKGERKDLDCILADGERFSLQIMDFTTETSNTAKHRSAIAPNIIHSLDATHLRMVARRLRELGLPMVFIHDSFATHCNHREVLYKIIVEEFIKLYSGNYLTELKEFWEAEYHVELDEHPRYGDWKPESLQGLNRFFM